ncbi:MAG: hypothetical protein H3Z54_11430 [archaeon]|nr:hypothetical protein [archaeon]
MSETIKALEILSWLRFRFMPACQADLKDALKFKNKEESLTANPFNHIDSILNDLQQQLLDQLANEYHEKAIKPSGLESEYIYLRENP